MKELQSLLGEANQMTRHVDTKLSMPIIPESVLYEVGSTVVDVPMSVGRMQKLENDYEKSEGIGAVVPPIAGFSDVLAEVQGAASNIMAITQKHIRTLREISVLTHQHVIHIFPHATYISKGGFFRIQITAKAAVFQILFLVGSNVYVVAYEGKLEKLADGSAFKTAPFFQIPPLLKIPSEFSSSHYTPAIYQSISSLLAETPYNAPQKQYYRSHTSDIFKQTAKMAEDLLAA